MDRTMANWSAFEADAPDLAGAGRRLIDATGIVFLATVRRDGAPRLHPIVPIFAGEGIYVAIPASSPKRRDLLRVGRYALHASLGPDDEEFALTGVAVPVTDAAIREAIVAAAQHTIHATDSLFEFQISRCLHTIWERVGQPDTRPIRRRWDVQ
ncbi:MAG: pyridoxamine 5'-phosphate oxidase family protein [Vicinamibacterales bacterium]